MAAEKQPFQISYEDVVMNFTQEEWEYLTQSQKDLYQNVMSETFKNLTFVGSKEKTQEPSPDLDDEDSPVCTGIFKGGPLFFCLTCGKCFKRNIFLLNHQLPRKSQRTTRRRVLGHKPLHRGERSFVCNLCGKTYRDASGLSRHRRAHLGYRPSSCPECGKCFRDKSEVKRHLKVHQNRKPVAGNQEHTPMSPCTTPGSQAPISGHVEVKQEPVAQTKATSSRASSLDVRSNSALVRRSRKKMSCPYCFKGFIKKTRFLTHLKFHFKNLPNQYLSLKEFSHLKLGSHKNTRRKQNIYCCPICDICFRGKGSLLDHLYHQTGQPNKCWGTLGHLLGFLHEPLVLGEIPKAEESSGEGKMNKMRSRKTR